MQRPTPTYIRKKCHPTSMYDVHRHGTHACIQQCKRARDARRPLMQQNPLTGARSVCGEGRGTTWNEVLAATTARAVSGAASDAASHMTQPFLRRKSRRQADDLRAEHAPKAQQAVSDGYERRRECGFGRRRAHTKDDSAGLWLRDLGPCTRGPACLQFSCRSSNLNLREERVGQTGVISEG